MSYWCSFPRGIIFSKTLNSEEKELWCLISDRLNPAGYCVDSNLKFSEVLGVSPKMITLRLASLKKKNSINIIFNHHKHERRIYLRPPDPMTYNESFGPNQNEFEAKKSLLTESFKKSIYFGNVEFNVLVEKLLEGPYLDQIKDNSMQFLLTKEQLKFLNWFTTFTNKTVDCQLAVFRAVDYEILQKKIIESDFLLKNNNLTLKWMLEHYKEIVNDKYKNYIFESQEYNKNFKQRNYSPDQINALFQPIEDIDI